MGNQNKEQYDEAERDDIAHEILVRLTKRDLTYLQALNILEAAQNQLKQWPLQPKE